MGKCDLIVGGKLVVTGREREERRGNRRKERGK